MNEEMGWIESNLYKRGIKLTKRGRRWADNTEVILFYTIVLLVFGVVGSIESGRWF